MGKISQLSSKYIIHATIFIEGIVDRPDVVGAVFGQTEGLLGSDLELRELQRSGRIGRIEVNVETRNGKTTGEIIIPSSLDKAETAIVASSLEVIQRIGPCNAKITVNNIEDIRISKRKHVIERAKELLSNLTEYLPDSQELAEEVSSAVRVMEIGEYGPERLPCGPAVKDSDEIVVVEGRADVLNLLRNGFKNAIAVNGTSVPKSVLELCAKKTATVFVDGDRGGDLIIKELLTQTDIDFITKAPQGMEVEELAKKEIHKALRARIAIEQYKEEMGNKPAPEHSANYNRNKPSYERKPRPAPREAPVRKPRTPSLNADKKAKFSKLLEDLMGTRGAYLLDSDMNVLGKVPVTEISTTLKNISGCKAVILDGEPDKNAIMTAEKRGVNYIVGTKATKTTSNSVLLSTGKDLK